MAITTRQTSLLAQQDWKTLYQTFREADFQSYDFETLRKSMIDYIRTYYPEDFNDFLESSEYIALIDLIAFLGQSLAFRTDLNARENFIDTAERRDSILKLARLISYVPKRNLPANGFLKITSISTTESVFDSNGVNLANIAISFNDGTNDMWQEQFTAIFNSALINSQVIGKPGNTQLLNGIVNSEYSLQLGRGITPIYKFTAGVNGNKMNFEAVSATSANQQYVYEKPPTKTGNFNILYRNDNLGNGSNNTGYFVYFKQGILTAQDFTVSDSLPNRVINFNFDNINNTDVWLYQLDSNGAEKILWKQVPSITGMNVVYNNMTERNVYQVATRANDQIDLVFGDGSFTNIPQGNFRVYFRQSNGINFKITPDEMQNVVVPLTYQSRTGRNETLTIRASLHYTVANSNSKETIDEIRTKAPQQYYTQDRMITGEDYNLFPYTQFSTILKVKSVNRTSSGISRYLDVLDSTGKYSSTNIFAQDGWLYRQPYTQSFSFTWSSTSEIAGIVYNQIIPLLDSKEMQHLYYDEYSRYGLPDAQWITTSAASTGSIGFITYDGETALYPKESTGNLRHVTPGAIVKFGAGTGKYFNPQNQIVTGTPSLDGDQLYLYAGVMDINDNIITLGTAVPDYAEVVEIIPQFKNNLLEGLVNELISDIQVYKSFGIRYDNETEHWYKIDQKDLGYSNNPEDFSLLYAGDTTGNGFDNSWLVKAVFNGLDYNIFYRGVNYIFESAQETRFFFDNRVKVYDTKTGTTLHDQIKILKINNQPDSTQPIGLDQIWYVYKNIIEADGHQSNRRILVTFPDSNDDGVPDDPDLFTNVVNPVANPTYKYVYLQTINDLNRFNFTQPFDNKKVISTYTTLPAITAASSIYEIGQNFYATDEDKFYTLSAIVGNKRTITERTDLRAFIGRQNLIFQYRHNSPNYNRIDPSPNNIMDLYILTKSYATAYTSYILDTSGKVPQPNPPTSEELNLEYSTLNNYKALSDTIIFNTAVFKPVFGSRANPALQAKFKVVKNPNIVISDNDIKSTVITAINNYFDLNNWEFGETFFFSELSAYLHTTLTPSIASIIIVPSDVATRFGNLYQINAEPNEIIISCATVNDVEIISAITAAQLNLLS